MATAKSSKVLNRINKTSGTVDKLKNAQIAKFDEFYTSLDDIDTELELWANSHPEIFKDKDIICPCDFDVIDSENICKVVISFGDDKRTFLGKTYYKVDKVITSEGQTITKNPLEWNGPSTPDVQKLPQYEFKDTEYDGPDAQEFAQKQIKCNFVKSLKSIGGREATKIHSLTASGYDVESGKGIRFQDIDYSKYDLCITNPPFSLYSEFMDKMMEEVEKRKDTDRPFNFILLAPQQNRVNPNVGGRLMTHEAYLGYGRMLPMNFSNPDKQSGYTSKQVAVDWITTFPYAQEEIDKKFLHTGIEYEKYKDDYPICELMTMKDGSHPIRCKSKNAIPDDYYGWIFAPVSVLNELSNNEFEWYVTNCKGALNDMFRAGASPFNHLVNDYMYKDSNGEGGFGGIIMKRKVAK